MALVLFPLKFIKDCIFEFNIGDYGDRGLIFLVYYFIWSALISHSFLSRLVSYQAAISRSMLYHCLIPLSLKQPAIH